MLDQNEGHSAVVGHCLEKSLISRQPPRRGADADDEMSAVRGGAIGHAQHTGHPAFTLRKFVRFGHKAVI